MRSLVMALALLILFTAAQVLPENVCMPLMHAGQQRKHTATGVAWAAPCNQEQSPGAAGKRKALPAFRKCERHCCVLERHCCMLERHCCASFLARGHCGASADVRSTDKHIACLLSNACLSRVSRAKSSASQATCRAKSTTSTVNFATGPGLHRRSPAQASCPFAPDASAP
jgi:hypothetical protein